MFKDLIEVYNCMARMGKDYVAPYGYTKKRVLFRVNVIDGMVLRNPIPMDTLAPFIADRTSGVKALPLVDTLLYTGAIQNSADPKGKAKVDSFVSLVRKISEFARASKPLLADQLEQIAVLVASGNLINMVAPQISPEDKPAKISESLVEFSFDGCSAIHESEDFQSIWLEFLKVELAASSEVKEGVSAVSGEAGQIARLAGSVKGTEGGQPSGASLTSFNTSASDSPDYGGTGSAFRFPMLHEEAHKINQAMGALLKTYDKKISTGGKEVSIPRYRRTIKDAMDILWFSPAMPKKSVTGLLLEGIGEEDVLTLENIQTFFREATGSKEVSEDTIEASSKLVGDYLLIMLAANSGRISVLSTVRGSLSNLKDHLEKYYRDYGYQPPKSGSPIVAPSVRGILEAVTPPGRSAPAPLVRQITLNILEGKDLPVVLVSMAVQRMAKELCKEAQEYSAINRRKVCEALLRAYVNNLQKGENMKKAELLGRLFARYVQAQESATDNKTLQGKYYSAMMATPESILPILDKLYSKYTSNLQKGETYVLKRVTELKASLAECSGPIPKRLSLEEQCQFICGYASEERERFTKKADRKVD